MFQGILTSTLWSHLKVPPSPKSCSSTSFDLCPRPVTAFLIEYIPSELCLLDSVHAMLLLFVVKSGMLPDSNDSTKFVIGGEVGVRVGDSDIRLGEKVGNSSTWPP